MYARRRRVLLLCVAGFFLSIVAIATGGEPQNDNSFNFESERGFTLISDQLPANGVNFTLILRDNRRVSSDPTFQREVTQALGPLAADRRVTGIQTAYTAPAPAASRTVDEEAAAA